jgi:hypothetical protein
MVMTMGQLKALQRADDIIIHNEGSTGYAIVKKDGQRIGTCQSRRDAMHLACAAAASTGATVWVCLDSVLEIYTEVGCP